ncbi:MULTISPECIES: PrgI family protein [Prauserella salsuginis group]|uniref:PrgI family protein n=1 Tax=Prauserella salsuginis TaxID=387889 RepID=A0ABW6FZX4_9PSEU|nr:MULTISPECIES: PrgI family protein [Prauserella salsuginis group]MCR3721118.1 PrgI family protein [Prauserella flava]MCR3734802.1 PrgI family protein [Prauserella salsuginis]
MTSPVRVPADVDRPDRVLGPLSARQLAILGTAGLLMYGLYLAVRSVVPLAVFLVAAVPIAVAVVVLAMGRRDGVSLDRLALAALRWRLSPRHRVAAPEGVRPAPPWLAAHASSQHTGGGVHEEVSAVPVQLPATGVADHGGQAGIVDLGSDGLALIAACSTVNFSLRTPGEQDALVAAFARFLHSLSAPVQILVRAERLDLTRQIDQLRARAGGLPHPALEAAARDHADYLAELTMQTDLLRRQVLLVLREPLPTAPSSETSDRWPWRRRRRDEESGNVDGARQAAEQRLARRLGEASDLLSTAGIVVSPLDAAAATGVLAAACNPDTFLPASAELAAADDIVTATTTVADLYDAGSDHEPDHPPARPGTAAPTTSATRESTATGPWLEPDQDWDYDDEIESR